MDKHTTPLPQVRFQFICLDKKANIKQQILLLASVKI